MELAAKVAIRPPTLDLWSEVVLSSIVKTMKEAPSPVFSLGDASDVSCIGEFSRFLEVMRPLPWLGVPGNHDGYYMGNMALRPDATHRAAEDTWQGACQHSSPLAPFNLDGIERLERFFIEDLGSGLTHVRQGTLTKTHGIWMYLNDLAARLGHPEDAENISSWKKTPDGEWYRYALHGEFSYEDKTIEVSARALIAALDPAERKHEKSRAWQASLVQDVTLPDGTHVLLIDTSDYAVTPPTSVWQLRGLWSALTKGCWELSDQLLLPGKCGEVESSQVDEIRSLMADWAPGTRFFVMGHHPWDSLSASSRRLLHQQLRTHPGFMTYVSGHVHTPAATRTGDSTHPWEVNIGSTTDWPMEYSRLHYWPDEPVSAGTPLHVEVSYARAPTQCPYASDDRAQSEVSYGTNEKYTAIALQAYEAILEELSSRGEGGEALKKVLNRINDSQRRCTSLRAQYDEPSHEPRWDVQRIPILRDLESCVNEQRLLLAELIKIDRIKLRLNPHIFDIEMSCAVWASALECLKNQCSSWKSRDLGGSQQRSFSFRIPANPFAAEHKRASEAVLSPTAR